MMSVYALTPISIFSHHLTAGHTLPDISRNLMKGKVLEAIGVAMAISPYEFSAVASVLSLIRES